MPELSQLLRWTQNVAFLAVGLWAWVRWRRYGTEQSKWLAATFGVLAVVVSVNTVTAALPDSTTVQWVRRITLALLGPFPYYLLRFVDSFEPVSRRLRRVVLSVALALSAVALFLPRVPAPDEPRGAAYQGFVAALAVFWLLVLPFVARRFWAAGADQPTPARRRMRLLSLGVVVLTLAVLLASGQSEATGVVAVLVQGAAVLAASLFLLGLAPLSALRTLWRQPEEQRLQEAALSLMAADSTGEVGRVLVPHMRQVVAARGVVLEHRGQVLAASGDTTTDGHGDEAIDIDLAEGRVRVWPSRYTPFFGADELKVLDRLALLADLALARTTLLASERDARRELEAANAELEAFVYSASHDLKGPVIAILSYLDVLEQDYGEVLEGDAGFYLDRMRSNGAYMEALVRDLLELSRVGRVDTAAGYVQLEELLEQVRADVGGTHDGLELVVAELPDVRANELRMRQLFQNLIANAAEHAGRADVRVEVTAAPADDDGVTILVRDNGQGVPAGYHDRVFGVFERLEPDDGEGAPDGTGIGLAICRKIMESLGGSIHLTEHEGGAEFALHFPADTVADERTTSPSTHRQKATT